MELTKKRIIFRSVVIGLVVVWTISRFVISKRGEPTFDTATETQQPLFQQSIEPDSNTIARLEFERLARIQPVLDELIDQTMSESEDAERFFSPDSRYAVHVVKSIDPYTYEMILAEESIAETNHFVDGIRLIDLNTNSDRTLVEPGQEGIHEHIGNIVWNLESDCIYFTGISDTAGCSEVFRCDIKTGSIESLASGGVVELILDDPYVGYLKILDTCFVEDEGGRHWYFAALSPDGKRKIQLTEPTLNHDGIY